MGKPKSSIIWKTSDRRAKRSEIWASGVSLQCTQGTFDTSVIKVVLGPFGAFPIFKISVSRKSLVVERNRVKCGPRGWVFRVYRALLTLKWLRSFWGHWVHFRFSKTCISKTTGCRVKQSEIGPKLRVFNAHRVLLTLQWLRSFWGHSMHSNFRQACISKMAGRRAKRIEIWAFGVSIQCTQGTFDTLVLKVILGSFGAFLIFEKHVSRRRLFVERNGVKFGSRGWVFSAYRVRLTLK